MSVSRRTLLQMGVAGLTPSQFTSGAWAQQSGPIKIGVLFPMSGGAGPQGQLQAKAVEAMASLLNERGGVLGRKIDLLVKDDESTPAIGISRANELIAERVSAVIEGFNSPVTLALQPLLVRAGILDITAISKVDAVLSGEGNPLAIRLNSSNELDGEVIAKYIAGTLKPKRIAFMAQNDVFGQGAQDSIESQLKKLGYAYERVAEEKFPFTQSDFRVALTNVKGANPDLTVVINASNGQGLPALIRQARQARLQSPIITSTGTMIPSTVELAGSAADGVVSADIYVGGVEPFLSNPVNKMFVERVRKLFNMDPDKNMTVSALCLQVWAAAAEELKTLEREPLAKRIRGGRFNGTIMGDVAFASNGQLLSRYYLFRVGGGKMIPFN